MKMQEAYDRLSEILEHEINVYQNLFELLTSEKRALIAADMPQLTEFNRSKEVFISKLRELEMDRVSIASRLAQFLGMQTSEVRLREICDKLGGDQREKLRILHETLSLLVDRVKTQNSLNQDLASSALENIEGALGALKQSLGAKPGYQREGSKVQSGMPAGHIVSREA